MILVISPAIDGLRREWREASANLGASSFQFWRYVGVPVLMPSLLGAMVLLFGNSFSAYATAYGLTGGGVNLAPLQIGFNLSGNVLDNPHIGEALAFGMIVVLAGMMLVYIPLQRISSGGCDEEADRARGGALARHRRPVLPDTAPGDADLQPQKRHEPGSAARARTTGDRRRPRVLAVAQGSPSSSRSRRSSSRSRC
jgi:ABC-type Fe3+ transport system permease subunit